MYVYTPQPFFIIYFGLVLYIKLNELESVLFRLEEHAILKQGLAFTEHLVAKLIKVRLR